MLLKIIIAWIILCVAVLLARDWVNDRVRFPTGVVVSSEPLERRIERGAYLARAAGCLDCHASPDAAGSMAGGKGIDTRFGTFYAPNISSDLNAGIGGWSDEDFVRAVTRGVAPDDSRYYPVFPYTSYSAMAIDDVLAIKAYIEGLEPAATPNRRHDLWLPEWARRGVRLWQAVAFNPRAFEEQPRRTPAWNRGAYVVNHLAHCGECHTPRTVFGTLNGQRNLAGTHFGPLGAVVPNITSHEVRGIGGWTNDEVVAFLKSGVRPDGTLIGPPMADVIAGRTGHLTEQDRAAVAVYIRSARHL